MKYLKEEGVKYVCEEILYLKRTLETCTPEDLRQVQAKIQVLRALLEAEKVEEPEEEIIEF